MAKCSAKDFFDAHTMFFFKEMQFATVEDESNSGITCFHGKIKITKCIFVQMKKAATFLGNVTA
jgi:hypothetical protein